MKWTQVGMIDSVRLWKTASGDHVYAGVEFPMVDDRMCRGLSLPLEHIDGARIGQKVTVTVELEEA